MANIEKNTLSDCSFSLFFGTNLPSSSIPEVLQRKCFNTYNARFFVCVCVWIDARALRVSNVKRRRNKI